MKKRKLGFAAVIGVWSLAAVFLACQSDVTEPTSVELDEDAYARYIYGYCKDPVGNPIYMAQVFWLAPPPSNQALGYCVTRWDGWYRIMDVHNEWEQYEGLDLPGEAFHRLEIYHDAENEILNFNPEVMIYYRPFEMDLNPGQGEIEKNGLFQAHVRNIETGDGIYPACVTVSGYDDVFLGYDTTWVPNKTGGGSVGRYQIHVVEGEDWHGLWDDYNGEMIKLTGQAVGYYPETIEIDTYIYGESYIGPEYDIHLEPIPE